MKLLNIKKKLVIIFILGFLMNSCNSDYQKNVSNKSLQNQKISSGSISKEALETEKEINKIIDDIWTGSTK